MIVSMKSHDHFNENYTCTHKKKQTPTDQVRIATTQGGLFYANLCRRRNKRRSDLVLSNFFNNYGDMPLNKPMP